jgi:hypothetical protein
MNKSLIDIIQIMSNITAGFFDEIETANISFVRDKNVSITLTTDDEECKKHFGKLAGKNRCDRISINFGEDHGKE